MEIRDVLTEVFAEGVLDAINLFEEEVIDTIAYNSILEESEVTTEDYIQYLFENTNEEETVENITEEIVDEIKSEISGAQEEIQVNEEESFENKLDKLLLDLAENE